MKSKFLFALAFLGMAALNNPSLAAPNSTYTCNPADPIGSLPGMNTGFAVGFPTTTIESQPLPNTCDFFDRTQSLFGEKNAVILFQTNTNDSDFDTGYSSQVSKTYSALSSTGTTDLIRYTCENAVSGSPPGLIPLPASANSTITAEFTYDSTSKVWVINQPSTLPFTDPCYIEGNIRGNSSDPSSYLGQNALSNSLGRLTITPKQRVGSTESPLPGYPVTINLSDSANAASLVVKQAVVTALQEKINARPKGRISAAGSFFSGIPLPHPNTIPIAYGDTGPIGVNFAPNELGFTVNSDIRSRTLKLGLLPNVLYVETPQNIALTYAVDGVDTLLPAGGPVAIPINGQLTNVTGTLGFRPKPSLLKVSLSQASIVRITFQGVDPASITVLGTSTFNPWNNLRTAAKQLAVQRGIIEFELETLSPNFKVEAARLDNPGAKISTSLLGAY